MALGAGSEAGRDLIARGVTWTLVGACLLMLTSVVLSRRGNLAWDDADYLRRGLADARRAAEGSVLARASCTLELLIQEQPKPPFLVAWLMLGAPLFGRANIDALIVHGSILPFALLLLATGMLARRLGGSFWAGLLATIALVASPRSLSFGGKVMVESFLGLWVMLALAIAAELATRPSRKAGALLGLVVGLALLTKLTALLLLAGGLAVLGRSVVRPAADRPLRLRAFGWALVACAVVAGPWYARNLREALRFGISSSRFNLDVEGSREILTVPARLLVLIAELPGWPLTVSLGAMGLYLALKTHPGGEFGDERDATRSRQGLARRFRTMVLASTLVAAVVLMLPSHFDTRFLLPLWPALSVVSSEALAQAFRVQAPWQRYVGVAALAASLALSAVGLTRERVSTTCWDAGRLIDELVARHGISNLANVGNTENWNVCKTGLVNELRKNPADCFVLHDLSAETAEGLRSRLRRVDAVVVLEPSAIPHGYQKAWPTLNRGLSAIAGAIASDPELVVADGLPQDGVPPLKVFIRDRQAKARAEVAQFESRLKGLPLCALAGKGWTGARQPLELVLVPGRKPTERYGDLRMPLLEDSSSPPDRR